MTNLSLIDRVLRFVTGESRRIREEADQRRELLDSDVPEVKDLIRRCVQAAPDDEPDTPGRSFKSKLVGIIPFLDIGVNTVGGLECTIRDWAVAQIKPFLDLTSVERREGGNAVGGGTASGELGAFAEQSQRAILGAAGASVAILALNALGAALDGAIQIRTLGQVRGAQKLVQNIIWSLGIADLGGLAFRPQIATSFQPLLERHYNAQAQAQLPGSQDLIRFLVREVFDAQRREELLAEPTPPELTEFMKQRGFAPFWTDSYWAAHWNLPSQTQLDEMVHRGVISQAEWERQVKLNDVAPESRPWLFEIIHSPYTRVDARRMADLGLLTSQELLQAYADIGYFAPKTRAIPAKAQFASEVGERFSASIHKAEGLFIFTRAFNNRGNFRKRFSDGVATPEQLRDELGALGVSDVVLNQVLDGMLEGLSAERAAKSKSLTASQITRAHKSSLISFAQALYLLIQLGYDSSEAELMLRLAVDLAESLTASTELGTRLTDGNV